MINCEKCGNCEIYTLVIDNFWSDWSEVSHDGDIWELKEENIFCKNCFFKENTDNLRSETNKKFEELEALIQSLLFRFDNNQETSESKLKELDKTISDFATEGVERFNKEKTDLLIAKKETELILEITKRDSELLKKDSKIAELELKINKLELGESETKFSERMKSLEFLVNNLSEITKSNQLDIDNLIEENAHLKKTLEEINESNFKDENQYDLIEES
ncbi:MAG: hypothetical protein AM1032_000323 [Mycoplasmataceae bacterium]|nr:MAG: hypothetical protein AM1032_000323 [Mycoplasmataceae bacterium]